MKQIAFMLFVMGVVLNAGSMGHCADDPKPSEHVAAIQEKIFHRSHEFDLTCGYMADDDFYHIYPFGAGYTFHLSEDYGFAVKGAYFFTKDKQLKERLQRDFSVTPTQIPEPLYMLHARALWKPLYGKDAVLNRWVVNRETYVFAGGGAVYYEWTDRDGRTREETAPSLSLGLGTRFFLTQKISLGFEIDNLFNFREDRTEYNLFLGLRLGYQFNLKPRQAEDDPEVKKLSDILKKEDANAK